MQRLSTVLVLCGVSACSDGSRVRTIEAPRVVEQAHAGLPLSKASGDPSGKLSSAHTVPTSALSASGPPATPRLRWDTPPSFADLAPTSMRQANFSVTSDVRAECYLTTLPGDAGGLEANVNRWRKQISLGPVGIDEIAALPRTTLLGREAVELDLAGTWQGMNADADAADYRMVGWLQIDASGSSFLRFVGPRAVVDAEIDAFRALAQSFRREAPTSAVEATAAAIAATSPSKSRGLSWTAPAGWQRAPDRALRDANFTIRGDTRAEAYVSVLFGEAGGVLANVNRWRKQMGREPLARAQLEDLPRITMLGGDALVVETEGTFTGMDGSQVASACLYGAVCQLADSTVFVKLTGPRAIVQPERERFLAFCASLTVAR